MNGSDSQQSSVGVVRTEIVRIELPPDGFRLEKGGILKELHVAYEAYGPLNAAGDNVVFICHALSGYAHVAGTHEPPDPEGTTAWWDEMVGPGKGINTDHYHVICANVLGGCNGTTGPKSINPDTGKPYGSQFPEVTVGDMVEVHRLLLAQLGIRKLACVVGGSLGGMQAMEWAVRYPDMIERSICIASAASLSTQAVAFDIVGRDAIEHDPDWNGGHYDEARPPKQGLGLARKVGHITYLSGEMMATKFGRERWIADAADESGSIPAKWHGKLRVETYLEHQADRFVRRFDANSYLRIIGAMDGYDLGRAYGGLSVAFERVKARMLIVAISSDWLFPPELSKEIANAVLRAGKSVSYCLLDAPHGHDAFLVDIRNLSEVIRGFLPWVDRRTARHAGESGRAREEGDSGSARELQHRRRAMDRRADFEIISDMVRAGTRVLDLGAGNGDLLALLSRTRNVSGVGVDIDLANVIDVIDKGHDIFQTDIDAGLAMIPDGMYDYAILSETLQVVKRPRFVLQEMLRVAHEGIISFPNFGSVGNRLQLMLKGKMPKGGALPYEWYETPNIHLFTYRDFVELCVKDGIAILEAVAVSGRMGRLLARAGLCNLGADYVLVRIARGGAGPWRHTCRVRAAAVGQRNRMAQSPGY